MRYNWPFSVAWEIFFACRGSTHLELFFPMWRSLSGLEFPGIGHGGALCLKKKLHFHLTLLSAARAIQRSKHCLPIPCIPHTSCGSLRLLDAFSQQTCLSVSHSHFVMLSLFAGRRRVFALRTRPSPRLSGRYLDEIRLQSLILLHAERDHMGTR